jgi:hypothetical protein
MYSRREEPRPILYIKLANVVHDASLVFKDAENLAVHEEALSFEMEPAFLA